ncbi:hypothetical protein MLD38_038999 [Melastoma candidum]|uniref:Uncharacterized protein n=1 Tax=Melastoma candidum TaxID=119954 RepID=A0ACB9L0N6_9MYRT|nr:hypothetical protein MLD38_038999 [Melastoma candidum]
MPAALAANGVFVVATSRDQKKGTDAVRECCFVGEFLHEEPRCFGKQRPSALAAECLHQDAGQETPRSLHQLSLSRN